MISQEDRNILRDVGRKYILEATLDSQALKSKLTFKEHVNLCNFISSLSYEDVIGLTITEDIKEFESKFKKFLKYSFAAIAGGIVGTFLGPGPPVAMFILYIFRKLTDTCSRSCLGRIPLSNQRKICRYECQVNAVQKIVSDLRSEISKCRAFSNPTKCEKSLRKEFIKWSRRLQSQMVKLNQAKLGVEEKIRKKRAKELAKKAKTIAASYQIPVSKVFNLVSEDKRVRENLTFRTHLKVYHALSEFSFKKKDNSNSEPDIAPVKIDPQKEKYARQALYMDLWVVPVPFLNDVVNYIIKKQSIACVGKCMKQSKYSKTLCINQCGYLSAKYAVVMLNTQLKKCGKSNNPVKCKKKLYTMLEDWKQREVERKIKFNSVLKSEMRKAKEAKGNS